MGPNPEPQRVLAVEIRCFFHPGLVRQMIPRLLLDAAGFLKILVNVLVGTYNSFEVGGRVIQPARAGQVKSG